MFAAANDLIERIASLRYFEKVLRINVVIENMNTTWTDTVELY